MPPKKQAEKKKEVKDLAKSCKSMPNEGNEIIIFSDFDMSETSKDKSTTKGEHD